MGPREHPGDRAERFDAARLRFELGFWGVVHYFTEMCSGSEAGSYFRLIDLVYHSTLGSSVVRNKTTKHQRASGFGGTGQSGPYRLEGARYRLGTTGYEPLQREREK